MTQHKKKRKGTIVDGVDDEQQLLLLESQQQQQQQQIPLPPSHSIFYYYLDDKRGNAIGDFLSLFSGLYSFIRYQPTEMAKYTVKCQCLWWFVDGGRGFSKNPDVDSIIRHCAHIPHVPVIIIYLHSMGFENRLQAIDMEAELINIFQYLNKTTGTSDIAVIKIDKRSEYHRLRMVTRDLIYTSVHKLKWFSIEKNPQYEPSFDCKVKLYHDACHSLNGRNLFEDISECFEKARRLILIMGWSLDYTLRMNRFDGNDETLGEQLCRKAEEGVMVCIFLWQDVVDLMKTENAKTKLLFATHSDKVHVRLRMRKKSLRQFSHHQKLIVCDGPEGLIAFCGGLDLTKGRFDTPSHELFSTLDTVHRDDFYNSTTNHERGEADPREPWHDCHSQIQGDVVWDMLNHFRAHWLQEHKFYKRHERQMTKKIYKMVSDLYPGNLESVSLVSGEWTVQFFTSVTQSQLFRRKVLVNDGILRAYINAINNAEKFIYIENQYFVGGSYQWSEPVSKSERESAPNCIPVLLADRIITKIRLREPFKVYIVLPHMPDGHPDSLAVTGVLYFQFKTIEMMYRRISKALKELGMEDKCVEDYLMFACLGKVEWNPIARHYERMFIYVHSKLMIVDDEYLLIGSANLNSRSLDGRRDSEICIGCSEAYMPCGKIRQYRECLWKEHFGALDEDEDVIQSLLTDTSVLFNPKNDPSQDKVFKKFKQYCVMNAQLFERGNKMINKGKSHIMKLPIVEDRDQHTCRARKITPFDINFDGKKPLHIVPYSIFT